MNDMDSEYILTGRDMELYERHGVLKLRLDLMTEIPLTGCHIDLSVLKDVGYVWMRPKPQAPDIIIAAIKNKENAPRNRIDINSEKKLVGVQLEISHGHPKAYKAGLTALYKE